MKNKYLVLALLVASMSTLEAIRDRDMYMSNRGGSRTLRGLEDYTMGTSREYSDRDLRALDSLDVMSHDYPDASNRYTSYDVE